MELATMRRAGAGTPKGTAPGLPGAKRRSGGRRGGSRWLPLYPLASPAFADRGRIRSPGVLSCGGTGQAAPPFTLIAAPPDRVLSCSYGVLSGRAERSAVLAAGQHALGLTLQLPHPLARDPQLGAQLGQRLRILVTQAVALD